jgi:hypothetical protein
MPMLKYLGSWRRGRDSNPRSPVKENQLTRAPRLTATGVSPRRSDTCACRPVAVADFSHPTNVVISDGMFTETFSAGILFGTSCGEGTASGVGTATFTADVVFTGGTGLFAGATGGATGLQMLMTIGPTTVSGSGTYVGFRSSLNQVRLRFSLRRHFLCSIGDAGRLPVYPGSALAAN